MLSQLTVRLDHDRLHAASERVCALVNLGVNDTLKIGGSDRACSQIRPTSKIHNASAIGRRENWIFALRVKQHQFVHLGCICQLNRHVGDVRTAV